jgi:hypothetical protein
MKKTLLHFFIALFLSAAFQAQTNVYHPFADSTGIWHERENLNNFQYIISGDTLINAVNWHKLSIGPLQQVINPANYLVMGAIREDSLKRVFYRSFNSTDIGNFLYRDSVYLLYDFSAQVGDTLFKYNPNSNLYYLYTDLVVTSIDSVFCHDHYRKRINSNYDAWIEGIGSTTDLFRGIRPVSTCGCGGTTLICFRENAVTYYITPPYIDCYNLAAGLEEDKVYKDRISVFPNPFSGETNLASELPLKDATLKIYNSLGREVKTITNINGRSVAILRDELGSGVYSLRLVQNEQVLKTEKLIIAEDKF